MVPPLPYSINGVFVYVCESQNSILQHKAPLYSNGEGLKDINNVFWNKNLNY